RCATRASRHVCVSQRPRRVLGDVPPCSMFCSAHHYAPPARWPVSPEAGNGNSDVALGEPGPASLT
ncbi:MAG: hypothetical protein ACPIOQ_16735, partial [Promethearchaeia archaeon]